MSELHFFPGQHVMVVFTHGKPGRRFDAYGGPEFGGSDPRMREEPTWPGKYTIHSIERHTTPKWPLSKIKWGTPLKVIPYKVVGGKSVPEDVWYQLPGGKWGSVNELFGITSSVAVISSLNNDYYNVKKVPSTWVFNDFGPMAIRYFKDLNGNGVLDGKERLSGEMIHTTPKKRSANRA